MQFLKSKTFVLTVLLQVAGPILATFGNWANVIQYVSGFGMAYALWDYFTNHKPEMDRMKSMMYRMHHQQNSLHEQIKDLKKEAAQ